MTRTGLGTSAVVLAVASVVCWLLSYSWLLGGVIPMDALVEFPVSPWLLAELAAIPLGIAAVLLAALARSWSSRRVAAAAWTGGIAALLSLLSVLGILSG